MKTSTWTAFALPDIRKAAFPILFGLSFVALFHAPLTWLLHSFSVPEYRLHACLLGAFCVYFFFLKPEKTVMPRHGCRCEALPCVVFLLSLTAYCANSLTVRSNIAACVCMGFTLYGMAGFCMERKCWLHSANIALLFVLCLPLSYHVETFAGFPLRLLSAQVAEHVLRAAGNHVHSAATILVLENSHASVDMPCSGIKSLFSIIMLCLVMSIKKRSCLGLKWVLALAASCLFAVAANTLRVLLLILIHSAWVPEFFRLTLHVPVGLLTFAAACLASMWVWKRLGPGQIPNHPDQLARPARNTPAARIFLLAVLCVAALANAMAVRTTDATPPAPIRAEPGGLPLTEQETSLFLRHGVSRYEKAHFSLEGLEGTVFLVHAVSWRGHHHPEQCLQAQGNSIEQSRTIVLPGDRPVRFVTLNNSDTAVLYWFQSGSKVTDDYAARVWQALVAPGTPFVMNSVYMENGKHCDLETIGNIANHFFAKSASMLGDNP